MWRRGAVFLLLLAHWIGVVAMAEPVSLQNPGFEDPVAENGWPSGWQRYGGGGPELRLAILGNGEDISRTVLLIDEDREREIGLYQTVAARPDETYAVSVRAAAVEGASSSGAYLQLRFLPSNELFQRALATAAAGEFVPTTVHGRAPAGTTHARLYIYTHKEPTPSILVDEVEMRSGVPIPAQTRKGHAVPEAKPPVLSELKDLHRRTPLLRGGRLECALVVPADGRYERQGAALCEALRAAGAQEVTVLTDADVALPSDQPLILLGNRSTNAAIGTLYDRFYTLLDLKYPGPGGYVVRTVHSPFGNGRNIVLVGGSDDAGVSRAVSRFSEILGSLPMDETGVLDVDWMAEVELGSGLEIPEHASDAEIWEASRMYGSSGYFGWNVISKCMALYYMTGEERFAREFLRLAFPDDAAIADLEELDGERIENKHDPLAGPYHYSASMMILFWDLIEESPLFSDEVRLRITNAFARQLSHRAREPVYGRGSPPDSVGNRHGDWSALSLYVLARYFQKDYPDPVWVCGLESCATYFSALTRSAWLAGRNDHLFWYTSYYDPIVDYMILSDDRAALEEGYFLDALRTQDVLFTGNREDWGLKASSLNFLQRTAYLTGDGKWLFYRQRAGLDTDGLRLGQSFWSETLEPRPPTELLDAWTIQPMPEPFWRTRQSGIPLEESFLWGSYRTSLDGSGDFVLLKGHNGAGRNPYHTFALLELRLGGTTVLKGYGTQVLTSADGMVEPVVAMDAALRDTDVLGKTAYAVGRVPRLAFCDWTRRLLLRSDECAVIADRFDYRATSRNMTRRTSWQTVGGRWLEDGAAAIIPGSRETGHEEGWIRIPALDSVCTSRPSNQDAARSLIDLPSIGIRLVKATQAGDFIEMTFEVPAGFRGRAYADLLNYKDRGVVRVLLDGEVVVEAFDHHAIDVQSVQVPLGAGSIAPGTHRLRVEAIRRREGLERCYIGLAGVALRDRDAPERVAESSFMLCPSDPGQTQGTGALTHTMTGPASEGDHETVFTLVGRTADPEAAPLTCQRLSPDAAAVLTPTPGVVVSGVYDGSRAELLLITGSRLSGRGVTAATVDSRLFESTAAVDLEWDTVTGNAHVRCRAPAEIAFRASRGLLENGEQVVGEDGLLRVALAPGTHRLTGVRLSAEDGRGLTDWLAGKVGEAARSAQTAQVKASADASAAGMLPTMFRRDLSAEIVDVVVAEDLMVAATGRTITAFAASGEQLWSASTEGDIRSLCWWSEEELLLAGCTDEQVIAFDAGGNVRWTFTSEMDRAVWEAAKQYWFKSAHPGIYGLDTGSLIGDDTQCFVGSACTLEILDGDGALVKRLPIFWGPGWRFGIRDNPNGSRDLLVARQPTDTHALAIVNSESLTVTGRGFAGVPDGHTDVTGWSTMSRNHLVIRDLDGDGEPEVVSEINGFWNRVTVWDIRGKPLHNAQIGPGKRIPYQNVRGLAVADLTGGGTCQIVVALDSGLLTVLDHRLERQWSAAMSAAPTVLCATEATEDLAGRILVGCADGGILALSPSGATTARASVAGRPTVAVLGPGMPSKALAVGTDAGQLTVFDCR